MLGLGTLFVGMTHAQAGAAPVAVAVPAAPTATVQTQLDTVRVTAVPEVGDSLWQLRPGEARVGTKTPTPIIDTPQAISVIDRQALAARSDRSISEALGRTSGVRAQAFGANTSINRYQLRGFDNASFVKNGLVLADGGAFLSWSTPIAGIERLEVLKGPSSVLYGGASAGGLVNIVTKAPVRQRLFALDTGVDEYGNTFTSVDSGGPLGAHLAYRAVGMLHGGPAQTDHARDNRRYAMAALTWRPAGDTALTLRASATRDRGNRPTGFLPYRGSVTPLANGRRIPYRLFISDPRVDRYDRDQYEIGADFRTALSDRLQWVSKARYGRMDLNYAGLYGAFAGNPVVIDGRYALNRGAASQIGRLTNIATDNRLVARFDTWAVQHTVLAGIDVSRTDVNNDQARGAAPALDIFAPDYRQPLRPLGPYDHTRQRIAQTGLYLQDQIVWHDWTLTVSGRHDQLDIATRGDTAAPQQSRPSKNTYRVGLVYNSAVGLAPYIGYATGFRAQVGTEATTGAAYPPETSRSLETGLRYQPEAWPVSLTASLFDIHRSGVLVAAPVAGFPRNQAAGGEQRSRGGELSLAVTPAAGWRVRAAATAFELTNTRGGQTLLGLSPTATPETLASLSAGYRFGAGSRWQGFDIGGGLRYTGASWADDANTQRVADTTVFDAGMHYDRGPFGIALNVRNLFNTHYVAACGGPGSCYIGGLRRATLTLRYRWGQAKAL